jgi:acyl carrier protein
MDGVLEKIKGLVAKKINIDKNDISKDTFLGDYTDRPGVNDLVIDTIGNEFGINISGDEAEEINTVGDIYELVKSKTK